MLAIVYILSISIAVTFKYNGVQTDFYTKYFIAAAWTALWIADVIRKGGLLQKQDLFFLKKVSMPPLIIFLWTIVLWVINRPERLNGAIMQTTVSNILALILATTCAISAAHFFGEKSILYTGLSIALSTFFNTIAVVPRYGIATFINYLKVAFIVTDLDYSSSITRLSLDLEVHDSTIACGVLIVYYLFFYNKRQDKENKFLQIIMICLMSICLYIGFKRLALYGIAGVCVLMFFLNIKEIQLSRAIKVFCIVYIILCFIYVAGLKSGFVEYIAELANIDFSGRFTFYSYLTDFYNMRPTYLGTGYGYINTTMYNALGYQSHSDIVRMYAELGFLPYLIWLWYNLCRLPLAVKKYLGPDCAKALLATTVYIFITYIAGNTMNLFASQFSYILIPIAMAFGNVEKGHKRVVLKR